MVNGGMHALENLSRGIMHLISNKKSYFLRDNNFFSAFLSHVEKKKKEKKMMVVSCHFYLEGTFR